MTIVTKPNAEKKVDKPLEKPLVVNENPAGTECDHTVLDPKCDDVEAWLSSTARRRVSTATTICVFITALLVMSVGIIGGVYLYRQFSHHQMSRFRGWCGIPYERDSLRLMSPKLPIGSPLKAEDDAEWTQEGLFKEQFELDLETDNYETINVPDFGAGHEGRFIHDFNANKTGIIDLTSRRCFVMPLDQKRVMRPRTLFGLIKNMWMGYYNVDTEILRKKMRVAGPPIRDYKPLGMWISRECEGYPTYRLEKIREGDMMKRSVDAVESSDGNVIEFVEFAGKNIVHLTIVDEGPENVQE